MQSKIKEVEVDGAKYQLTKLDPVKGCFIWQQLMSAIIKRQSEMQTMRPDDAPASDPDAAPKSTPEQRLRSMCGLAFMSMTYKDFEFMQSSCMRVVFSLATGSPMPIMTDSGQWTKDGEAIRDNPMLMTRMTVEALVHSLAPFLEESSTT